MKGREKAGGSEKECLPCDSRRIGVFSLDNHRNRPLGVS